MITQQLGAYLLENTCWRSKYHSSSVKIMNFDLQQVLANAATIDELLGLDYEPQIGQKDSTDRAALRLAAWCRSASSGDWGQFFKRITRDALSIEQVLAKFADVRRAVDVPQPAWFVDAEWAYQALTGEFGNQEFFLVRETEPRPFEKLFYALVEQAEKKLSIKQSHKRLHCLMMRRELIYATVY